MRFSLQWLLALMAYTAGTMAAGLVGSALAAAAYRREGGAEPHG